MRDVICQFPLPRRLRLTNKVLARSAPIGSLKPEVADDNARNDSAVAARIAIGSSDSARPKKWRLTNIRMVRSATIGRPTPDVADDAMRGDSGVAHRRRSLKDMSMVRSAPIGIPSSVVANDATHIDSGLAACGATGSGSCDADVDFGVVIRSGVIGGGGHGETTRFAVVSL